MCQCGQATIVDLGDERSRRLISHAVAAAGSQVAHTRAASAALRARVLIGDGAGRESDWAAEQHAAARAASLRQVSLALADFTEATSPDEVSRADSFIAAGTVRDLTARARHLAIATMLDSGISAAHAQEALDVLLERTGQVETLGSVEELTRFLDAHVQRLADGPRATAELPSGLCLLILILTSVFVLLVVIAALVCAFSLGTNCDDILNQLIAQACRGSAG
ncbi:MAG TPA: hypothetical protein VGQ05_24185 [Streptosporangiaceae bacterium]|nr:hypothetical protein [Streptosporangiaceae bacterium]